jgi:SAM-dependent methyltransferase
VSDRAELVRFYEGAYSKDPAAAAVYARWRALGAVGKADHVVALCNRAELRAASTLDVGCGDGALLSELHRRGVGGRLAGMEIAQAAVEIARGRAEINSVERFDGVRLPAGDGEYDLGILSHVLEHVPDPAALLTEAARVCRAVVLEVPLEDNWSARRRGKREGAAQVGHIQRLSRRSVRAIVAGAGLKIACELDDPLPLGVHRFFTTTTQGRLAATAKWGLRAGLHRIAPFAARRLFTLHYACLCLPGQDQPGRRRASA